MISMYNMILQITIFGALSGGILYVKKRRIYPHGYLTLAAVSLNAVSIVLVMMPSALRILSGGILNAFTVSVAVHSVLGLAVEALGIYVVYNWRFRKPGVSCTRRRGLMRPLALFWTVSLALGAVLYLMLT